MLTNAFNLQVVLANLYGLQNNLQSFTRKQYWHLLKNIIHNAIQIWNHVCLIVELRKTVYMYNAHAQLYSTYCMFLTLLISLLLGCLYMYRFSSIEVCILKQSYLNSEGKKNKQLIKWSFIVENLHNTH